MGAGLVSTQGRLTEPQPELILDCCWEWGLRVNLTWISTASEPAGAEQRLSLTPPLQLHPRPPSCSTVAPGALELNSTQWLWSLHGQQGPIFGGLK